MSADDFKNVNPTADQFVKMIKEKADQLPVVGKEDLFGEVTTQANLDLALERLGSFAAAVSKRVI